MHTLLTCYSGFFVINMHKMPQEYLCVLHFERKSISCTQTHSHSHKYVQNCTPHRQIHRPCKMSVVWMPNGRMEGINLHIRNVTYTKEKKETERSKAKKLIPSRIMCDSVRLNTCSTSCKLMRIIETCSIVMLLEPVGKKTQRCEENERLKTASTSFTTSVRFVECVLTIVWCTFLE